MKLQLPDYCLVLLVGVEGAGKTHFAQTHFQATEIVGLREAVSWVADESVDSAAQSAATEVMELLVSKRLERRLLTVIDAPNLKVEVRRRFLNVARRHHTPVVAVILESPEPEDLETWGARRSLRRQRAMMKRSLRGVRTEGYAQILRLNAWDKTQLERLRAPTDLRNQTGGFDVVGDLHGCLSEFKELLGKLGYEQDGSHSRDRRLVLVGDLVDRGPDVLGCLELVQELVSQGRAFCVAGNHDRRLARVLRGRKVRTDHGLENSLEALQDCENQTRIKFADFLEALPSHLVLDEERLVVTHAGLKAAHLNRDSRRVEEFCLYGDTRGEIDEFGISNRPDWVLEYSGKSRVVYGHAPVLVPEWCNRTINIDTGAVFGGSLTALRYPEMELVSVPAKEVYAEPFRPMEIGTRPAELIRVDDLLKNVGIPTRFGARVELSAEERAHAFEALHSCVIPAPELHYLPPSSACGSVSPEEDFLERPEEAFKDFKGQGVSRMVFQEKHGGARAVLLLRKDKRGWVYGRAGRTLFASPQSQQDFLDSWTKQLEESDFWSAFETDWVCMEGQLIPVAEVERLQFREEGDRLVASGTLLLEKAQRLLEPSSLRNKLVREGRELERYRETRERFVQKAETPHFAPLQILATQGRLYHQRPHQWHLEQLQRYLGPHPRFQETAWREVDGDSLKSVHAAVRWWEKSIDAGGLGGVVKPSQPLSHARVGWATPALEVRSPDYLRLLYGVLSPQRLETLKARDRQRLREVALEQFLLGLEALELLIEGEPLHQRHRALFAIMALENRLADA